MPRDSLALMLPGGGAMCAYQVGVLKALVTLRQRDAGNPFQIIVGTSGGAVAALTLASGSANWVQAVTRLEQVWANFRLQQVMHVDRWSMWRAGLRWLASLITAGRIAPPRSLLNNTPLRQLLESEIDLESLREALRNGTLDALALSTTAYGTGRSVTFFETRMPMAPWQRRGRQGIPTRLTIDYVMASVAIPALFPAVEINGAYYGDGAMRQSAPLSAAIRLGANRVLIAGVRREEDIFVPAQDRTPRPPTPADIFGLMLDTLFTNRIFRDMELANRLNQFSGGSNDSGLRHVEVLRLAPSVDLTAVAAEYRDCLPGSISALLGVLGGRGRSGNLLASYLLFEAPFTRRLIDIGFEDTMRRRDELQHFLEGS